MQIGDVEKENKEFNLPGHLIQIHDIQSYG
jgi:hypothetical protein